MVAMAQQKPKTPHSGSVWISGDAFSVMANARIASMAWRVTFCWLCSTNLGLLVVPDVVKMATPAAGNSSAAGRSQTGRCAVSQEFAEPYRGNAAQACSVAVPAGLASLAGWKHRDQRLQGGQIARIDVAEDRRKIDAAEVRPQEQRLGAGPADDIGHLGAAVARVDHDRDGADPGRGDEQGEPFRAVRQPERDPVAPADAEAGQRPGGVFGLPGQIGQADRPAAERDLRRRPGAEIGDGRTRRGHCRRTARLQAGHPVAQLELLHLAGRCLGQVGENDGSRRLEMGEIVPAMADDLLGRRGFARLEGDEGAGGFAPLFVRAGDHGGFEHLRMAEDHAFDLDGRNILAAGNDDVLRRSRSSI